MHTEISIKTLITLAMTLITKRGWCNLTLQELATEASVPLSEIYHVFPEKRSILTAFSRHIDQAVLAQNMIDDLCDPPRDRLFEILMRRFEILQPYREGIQIIAREWHRDLVPMIMMTPQLIRSMRWMLRLAAIDVETSKGSFLAVAVSALYVRTLRVWLTDQSTDMSRTMAVIDRNLKRLEQWTKPWPSISWAQEVNEAS